MRKITGKIIAAFPSLFRWLCSGRKKIASSFGESLIETIVAMLVIALASVMLAGAIYSSTISVNKSRQFIDAYYGANEADNGVIRQDRNSGEKAIVTICDKSGTLFMDDFPIRYYTNTADPHNAVVAYHLAD